MEDYYMLFFMNDYSEGAHPRIIEAITKTNNVKQIGYGLDEFCKEAKVLLKKRINRKDVDIHFIPAGTLTNLIAISSFLKPYEAVITSKLGHIAVHETGAIEATGHRLIEVASTDGIIRPEQIDEVMLMHVDEHMVLPRLVYISNATEMGTIYDKEALIKLREKCDEYDLLLYIDGARLGNAITCKSSNLTLNDIANLSDAFYIGGTKNGILFGEALVICNPSLKPYIRYSIKQKGGLLAKGRLLGIQFTELFKDDLYFDLSIHTNKMADMLKNGIINLGYKLVTEPSTNLIFTILPNQINDELKEVCHYEAEFPHDLASVEARFVTSWATTEEDVHELLKYLKLLKEKYSEFF